MDLVTRKEFDVQTKVLARTREKFRKIEARLAALENLQKENLKIDIQSSYYDLIKNSYQYYFEFIL